MGSRSLCQHRTDEISQQVVISSSTTLHDVTKSHRATGFESFNRSIFYSSYLQKASLSEVQISEVHFYSSSFNSSNLSYHFLPGEEA
jgi:uncharacterized protein YjbI with pentapeptide repeats